VRDEPGRDADATRDGAQRHGIQPLLQRDLARRRCELGPPLVGVFRARRAVDVSLMPRYAPIC
jgi:hypothetical protein